MGSDSGAAGCVTYRFGEHSCLWGDDVEVFAEAKPGQEHDD